MKKSSTRDHLLEVATRLFHLQGYQATGLNQILKESGTPKGSLYHYFPDGKNQLVKEVVESSSQRLLANIQIHLNSDPNPTIAVQNYLNHLSENFKNLDTPDMLNMPPFALISMESAFENEEIRVVCQENYSKVQQHYYNKFVESGMATDKAKILAVSLNAAIIGVLVLSITEKSNEPIKMLQKTVPSFFL
ncbi:TetR family transcriptional regulator [Lysinibacillus sp. KCTC 33748]|uniref:TetR/AcrR family transcriptional regulator n=1 Tax=unclassified Lysinibacillus TaxID=2636778 RepID=UPI0009A83AF2|nr:MULTISPECIES: TetR/AcrR family transcriptional regulator [unclassified Lysinibacillus]OXS72181.1 TetR family transcriptional regulator [Lysinibacillus sp. KCTC 33748]SKB98134.1 transcriptional regulator, TetR family [Lysinibacillus sp. AC-3]